MTRCCSVAVAILLAAAFLVAGHRAWLVRRVSVSIDLKFQKSSVCQMFYTDSEDAGLWFRQALTDFIKEGGARAVFSLPVERLERLRFDFGTEPGTIYAGPIVVGGADIRVLNWRDFTIRHDIGRFNVDDKGCVDILATGGDPYAACPQPLGLQGGKHVNWFALSSLVFVALVVWWPLAGRRGILWNSVPQDGDSVFSVPVVLLVGLLVAARFVLTARIPAFFGRSPWDDGWFANAAASLLRGDWLGQYDMYTLCKGCFGPMVMAFSSSLGIPFLVAETALYVSGCAYFVRLLTNLVKNRVLIVAAFAFLLFNPLSFSFMTWQRVYRNGMSLWQVPLVFGCFLSVFLASRRGIRSILFRSFSAGVALWSFLNTREDAVWIAPFVLACLAFSATRTWKIGSGCREKTLRALACFAAIVVVFIGNAALCAINWHLYGLPLRNDRNAGNYAEAMRDLYLIEPDPEDEARLASPEHEGHYHNISYSTLCKAYDASPTLRSVRRQIDVAIDDSARADGYSERDLHLDHMLFAIRLGVFRAGHYATLRGSETFFGNVHSELEAAFRDGRLRRRRGFAVTAMSAPFKIELVPRIFREWGRALCFVAAFGGTECVPVVLDDSEKMRFARPHMVPVFGSSSCETTVSGVSLPVVQKKVAMANVLSRTYSVAMPWILVAMLVAYAALTISLAIRRSRFVVPLDWWIFSTGVLASILLHTACIAYVSATTFGATSCQYLASSYQLALMFVVVTAGMTLRAVGFSEAYKKGSNP